MSGHENSCYICYQLWDDCKCSSKKKTIDEQLKELGRKWLKDPDLKDKYDELLENYNELSAKYNSLNDSYNYVLKENKKLKDELNEHNNDIIMGKLPENSPTMKRNRKKSGAW